jgi:hypothetical protein
MSMTAIQTQGLPHIIVLPGEGVQDALYIAQKGAKTGQNARSSQWTMRVASINAWSE